MEDVSARYGSDMGSSYGGCGVSYVPGFGMGATEIAHVLRRRYKHGRFALKRSWRVVMWSDWLAEALYLEAMRGVTPSAQAQQRQRCSSSTHPEQSVPAATTAMGSTFSGHREGRQAHTKCERGALKVVAL